MDGGVHGDAIQGPLVATGRVQWLWDVMEGLQLNAIHPPRLALYHPLLPPSPAVLS